jgi:hypothetical protein
VNYPDPQTNPICQCKDNPMQAFFCPFGHMLECHYPYECQQAACSHLRKYDFEEQDIQLLEKQARDASNNNQLEPYIFDEYGNASVKASDEPAA